MSSSVAEETRMDEKEMRVVFAETLEELAREDPRVIYLDADLCNSVGMVGFSERYPRQAVNCGIQEANMIGTAAGLSAVGMIPYAHTFATFASRRALDQVYISAAYARLNLRVIGSDPGITAAFNGGTHMAFEDMGLMRAIPEVTCIEPVDAAMLEDVLRQTKDLYGVFYIRLSRKRAERIYDPGATFEIGKAITLREGDDVTIAATGICVAEALRAAASLQDEGVSARVLNVFTLKPVDVPAIVTCARETGAIVTAENHSVLNGLGSAVAEVVGEHHPVPVERVGIRDQFGEVGTVEYLRERFRLTAADIAEAARRALARKPGERGGP